MLTKIINRCSYLCRTSIWAHSTSAKEDHKFIALHNKRQPITSPCCITSAVRKNASKPEESQSTENIARGWKMCIYQSSDCEIGQHKLHYLTISTPSKVIIVGQVALPCAQTKKRCFHVTQAIFTAYRARRLFVLSKGKQNHTHTTQHTGNGSKKSGWKFHTAHDNAQITRLCPSLFAFGTSGRLKKHTHSHPAMVHTNTLYGGVGCEENGQKTNKHRVYHPEKL